MHPCATVTRNIVLGVQIVLVRFKELSLNVNYNVYISSLLVHLKYLEKTQNMSFLLNLGPLVGSRVP